MSKDRDMKDDSLKRWDNQSESEKYVWDYFNDVIAKKIVTTAIDENGTTLANIYHKLAIARAQCEWIKHYISENRIVNPSHEIINEIVKNNIYLSYPRGFASFQFGGSEETNLEGWGDTIAEFAEKRMKFDSDWYVMSTAQSIAGSTSLNHPKGSILDKLEFDFQQLCDATNLFEYLKIASRLMFALSNFPPITRGSSSVNTWLIDFIAQNKFNLSTSLRPMLHDWTAFFETPEQYTNFYVISASVQYVKSLNKIKGIDEFERKLLVLMKENPNIGDNIEHRESLWNELKLIIQSEIASNAELNESEKNRLNEIALGNLVFRKPSDRILKIIDILLQNKDVINNIELLSTEDKQYFKELLELKYNAGKRFLSSYETGNEEKINLLMSDCEALNQLESSVNKSMFHFDITPSRKKIPAITKEEKELADLMDYIQDNPICKWGFILPENINQYNTLLELAKNIQNQVALALMNGMDLNELNRYVISNKNITSRDIEVLTSRAAILLYKLKDNVSINELVSISPEKTEMKILQLVASNYCNEDDLKFIHDAQIRNCLLLYLDPCLFKYKNLSGLVGGSEEETKKNILSVYLEKYNLTSLPITVTNDNVTQFLNTIISYDPLSGLTHIKKLEYQLLQIEKKSKLQTNYMEFSPLTSENQQVISAKPSKAPEISNSPPPLPLFNEAHHAKHFKRAATPAKITETPKSPPPLPHFTFNKTHHAKHFKHPNQVKENEEKAPRKEEGSKKKIL